jgi:hypothetical protein
MMRSLVKIYCGVIAVAVIAMAATTVWAEGLLLNSDVETETRFLDHRPPVDMNANPNSYPDGWHHSANSAWSGDIGGNMFVSPSHSLYIPDNRTGDHDEMRSFGTPIPDVGLEGRSLWLMWKWKWNKQDGDLFSATVRTSTQPAPDLSMGQFDLMGNNDNPMDIQIRDHLYLTDGSADSNGFQMFMTTLPLLATEQSFDVIFRTRDNEGDSSELGTMWVDDIVINYHVPEPATIGLLGLAGFGLMMVSRRQRS